MTNYINRNTGANPILDANDNPVLSLVVPKGPTSLTINVDGRKVLTFRRDGDKFTAEYDPADLDAAARVFVDEVRRLLGAG